jgi:hypothetical protein
VEDLVAGPDALQFTVTSLFERPHVGAPLRWTGNLPVRATRALREAGFDARRLLDPDRAASGVTTNDVGQ